MSNEEIVLERATEVLGDTEKALDWVDKESKTLGGKPSDICTTRMGLERVLRHLHGVEICLSE